MNLASNLVRTAHAHPSRIAIRLGDATTTYAQLDRQSAHVAGLLRDRGVAPGDRVAIMLPNTADFAALYYGILRAGAIVVPMNPLLKGREIAYYLSDSGAALIFVGPGSLLEATSGATEVSVTVLLVDAEFTDTLSGSPAVTDIPDCRGADTAVILYTSGTTGAPKGAELTHDNLINNAEVFSTTLLRLTPDDVLFGGLPLFHSFGQTCTLNSAVRSGACLTLLPRFDPVQALSIIAAHRATVFAGVPTMYGALLAVPEHPEFDVSSLRVCISGGASLPVEVLHAVDDAFNCPVLEGYGLSETSPVASFNHPDRVRKPGSIGTPIAGVEMAVVDSNGTPVAAGTIGEIVIRGHNLMKGYWQRPAETADVVRAGWFHTGDLATVDDDGYFFIVDRKKDLIIRGGYNVYPREVEEILYEHPGVAEAAVIGAPDDNLGEEVCAAVTLKPGATVTAAELREHVKHQLAAYKYPRHVWFVDALPKGPTGKILKRDITLPPDLDR